MRKWKGRNNKESQQIIVTEGMLPELKILEGWNVGRLEGWKVGRALQKSIRIQQRKLL